MGRQGEGAEGVEAGRRRSAACQNSLEFRAATLSRALSPELRTGLAEKLLQKHIQKKTACSRGKGCKNNIKRASSIGACRNRSFRSPDSCSSIWKISHGGKTVPALEQTRSPWERRQRQPLRGRGRQPGGLRIRPCRVDMGERERGRERITICQL